MKIIELPLLPYLDLTKFNKKNTYPNANINFIKTKHKLSTNSLETGNDPLIPIFGCECWLSEISNSLSSSSSLSTNKNNEEIIENTKNSTTYGFPIIIVNQNQNFDITMNNLSTYDVNIHYHGVNFNPFNDGASDACIFGPNTQIGITNRLNCTMNNNSSLCWYHPHNMYEASEFVYMGMVGFIQTIDKLSNKLDTFFEINNNYLVLLAFDNFINSDGTLNKDNLYTDQWRGTNTAINGINCINWINDDSTFIDNFYHETTKNIIKISILNGNCSWRRYYVGVVDKNNKIKKYYLIESDTGYRNPLLNSNTSFGPGSRVSIMFDLNDFEDNEATIFFYDYDRTKNNGLVYENVLLNPTTDDSGNKINVPYPCGLAPPPVNFNIKKFLKIKQRNKTDHKISNFVKYIKKMIFGKNYYNVKKLTNENLDLNYWKYLNPKYFYSLPNFNKDIPKRKFIFFPDDRKIALINNSTEFFNGQNRVFVDVLNSEEYAQSKLPTCLFKIKKYDEKYISYSNNMMNQNHLLIVSIYDLEDNLLEKVEINFLPTNKPLNIEQWSKLVNEKYINTKLKNLDKYNKLSEILEYKWELVEYKVQYLANSLGEYYKQPASVKSVLLSNINKSSYLKIELKAQFSLLNYFGKPFGVMEKMNMECCCKGDCNCGTNCCCEMNQMEMNNLQQLFIYGGSVNGISQLPDSDGNFKFLISPKTQYNGYVDGILNDNFMNFSVKKDSSELWIYNNLDNQDSHPFHFHMTSGFVRFDSKYTSKCIKQNIEGTVLEYSKDNYSIGPQQSLAFNIKFVNHTSFEGQVKYLGYMYHCHFMAHHDMSMMGQYFVY